MKAKIYKVCSLVIPVVGSVILSSCNFGFMSFDEQKAPLKATVNFSSDPRLVPSRLIMNTQRSTANGADFILGVCEKVSIQVANQGINGKSLEVKLNNDITVYLSSRGDGRGLFYSSENCSGSSIDQITLSKGESFRVLSFKPTNFKFTNDNAVTLSAQMAGFKSENKSVNVDRIPLQLELVSDTSNLEFGNCREVRAITKDGMGKVFGDNGTVTLMKNILTGDIYPNNNCSGSSSSSITNTNGTVTFSFKTTDTALGTSTTLSFTASTGSLTSSLSVTVIRSVTSIAFYHSNASVNSDSVAFGNCLAMTLKTKDVLGNFFGNHGTVTLTKNNVTGDIYPNNNCSGSSSSSIINTNGTVTFSFKTTDLALGNSTVLGFTAQTGSLSASLSVTILHLVLDTSFSIDGMVALNGGEILSMVKVSSSYLIAGYTIDSSAAERAYVALVNSTGGLVTSFTETNTGKSSRITSMVVEDSNIYFAGTVDVDEIQGKDWLYGKLSLVENTLTISPEWIKTVDLNTVDDVSIGIESVDNNQLVLVGDKFDVAT
ncbi:MAG: hypothetical protein FJ112_05610, partial [Deltaproteobacteria bacterium]|nr:hypothetical protein [Deltaproteobacteria bacterium]